MLVRTHHNMREERYSHVAILALATRLYTHRNMSTADTVAELEHLGVFCFLNAVGRPLFEHCPTTL